MADAYQSVEDLRRRLAGSYQPKHFFDHNEEKQFADLLETLETHARGVIENHHSDEPFSFEEGREDVLRATDDAAIRLVYPIRDVSNVEIKRTIAGDWDEIDSDRWDWTDHSLVLRRHRLVGGVGSRGRRRNELTDFTQRRTWVDIAAKIRVTYDRGWDPVPGNVLDVQTELVTRMLRNRRMEQNMAAVEPEGFSQVSDALVTLTDEQRETIDSITGLGLRGTSV